MLSWPNHLQSPGVPSHTQVREPQNAMRHQEQPPVQGLWSPHSAMEAMNQSGQPRNSRRRGPMQPVPLTLDLEEITCRGWGPHLQYSFLIKLASLSGKYALFFLFKDVEKKMELKSPKLHTPGGIRTKTPWT